MEISSYYGTPTLLPLPYNAESYQLRWSDPGQSLACVSIKADRLAVGLREGCLYVKTPLEDHSKDEKWWGKMTTCRSPLPPFTHHRVYPVRPCLIHRCKLWGESFGRQAMINRLLLRASGHNREKLLTAPDSEASWPAPPPSSPFPLPAPSPPSRTDKTPNGTRRILFILTVFTFLHGRFAGCIVPGGRSRDGRNYRPAVAVCSVIAHSTQSRPLHCT